MVITFRWGRTTCTQRSHWLATSLTWKRPWSLCLGRHLCVQTWTMPRRWRTTTRSRSARSLWMETLLTRLEHSLEVGDGGWEIEEDVLCDNPSIFLCSVALSLCLCLFLSLFSSSLYFCLSVCLCLSFLRLSTCLPSPSCAHCSRQLVQLHMSSACGI